MMDLSEIKSTAELETQLYQHHGSPKPGSHAVMLWQLSCHRGPSSCLALLRAIRASQQVCMMWWHCTVIQRNCSVHTELGFEPLAKQLYRYLHLNSMPGINSKVSSTLNDVSCSCISFPKTRYQFKFHGLSYQGTPLNMSLTTLIAMFSL